MKKCSGRWCIHKERCLRYAESLKKTKMKGRWVNSLECVESNYNGDEMVSEPHSELLLKGDTIGKLLVDESACASEDKKKG